MTSLEQLSLAEFCGELKSVNLQYNTLGRLDMDDGTFMISCKSLCKNAFNLFSYFFYKITKIKIKSFECPKSKKYKKNTWNIRFLVDDSFVPSSKQPSVIYCRLTNF